MGGLTVEDVNAIQDEMNKIEPTKDEVDATAKATADAEALKLEEAKTAEDKAKADAEAKIAAEADKGKEKADEEVDDVRELKEQLRNNREALTKISADYQKLHKIMVDKGLLTEEEVTADKAKEAEIAAANAERQAKLTEMVTIMEVNPNYSDVRQVCTQGNFDDVIEAFSKFYVKENGGNLNEVASKMESEVWAEPNPYKKMYEIVKKYHPKFAVVDDSKTKEAADAAKKIAEEADKTKDKKVVDANPSAASLGAGGSGAGSSGWTSAKIDALDEDEIQSKVPKDIYDKYLKGILN